MRSDGNSNLLQHIVDSCEKTKKLLFKPPSKYFFISSFIHSFSDEEEAEDAMIEDEPSSKKKPKENKKLPKKGMDQRTLSGFVIKKEKPEDMQEEIPELEDQVRRSSSSMIDLVGTCSA